MFFNDLCFMTRGPIVVAVLEKDNAVEALECLLDLLTLIILKIAQLEKICKIQGENAVHGSDSTYIEISFT